MYYSTARGHPLPPIGVGTPERESLRRRDTFQPIQCPNSRTPTCYAERKKVNLMEDFVPQKDPGDGVLCEYQWKLPSLLIDGESSRVALRYLCAGCDDG
jgi:hypothetical protein